MECTISYRMCSHGYWYVGGKRTLRDAGELDTGQGWDRRIDAGVDVGDTMGNTVVLWQNSNIANTFCNSKVWSQSFDRY